MMISLVAALIASSVIFAALVLGAQIPFNAHSAAASALLSADPSSPNVWCIVSKCGVRLTACMANSGCRQAMDCMRSCKDGDSMCQSKCFFKYANDEFNNLVGCMTVNKCIPAMTWSNYTCPSVISNRVPEFNVSMLARQGRMLVARGSDDVFDCFDCQLLQFQQLADGGVQTHWSTTIDGEARGASYILRQETANSVVTKYSLFGMPVEEHYYIMDFTEGGEYILYFYCGYGFGGEYQGALIYAKEDKGSTLPIVLPVDVERRFAGVLQAAGLEKYTKPSLGDFCIPNYPLGSCKNI